MTLAVMQPYLFPYLGYFQLIHAVDRFVIYDDVNYIKKGWVNRNNILEQESAGLFTVPLVGASQNRLINEIDVSMADGWQEKLLRRMHHAYGKAPFYAPVKRLVEGAIGRGEMSIAKFNLMAIADVTTYLDMSTAILESSVVHPADGLKGRDRILDICLKEGAVRYINPIGGVDLYDRSRFQEHGVELCFLRSQLPTYVQFSNPFVPGLSIIDVLMFNSVEQVRSMLDRFELV